MTGISFWIQVIMAWAYTLPQLWSIVKGRTQGLTLALYASFMIYLLLSLSLAIASFRLKKERLRLQTIVIFGQWTIFIFLILVLGSRSIIWRNSDTVVTLAIILLSLATLVYYRGLADPMARSLTAVWCKAVPQLWLAVTLVMAQGSGGLPLLTVVAGNFTGILRLVQIYRAGKEGGWDKPTKGLLFGEAANVLSWAAVTLTWAILRIFN